MLRRTDISRGTPLTAGTSKMVRLHFRSCAASKRCFGMLRVGVARYDVKYA